MQIGDGCRPSVCRRRLLNAGANKCASTKEDWRAGSEQGLLSLRHDTRELAGNDADGRQDVRCDIGTGFAAIICGGNLIARVLTV
jgi:hypothetical protein